MSGDKPTQSDSSAKYKLIEECLSLSMLEDKLEDGQPIDEIINDLLVKTNIPQLSNTLLYYIAENESMEEALFNEIERLKERKNRFKKKADDLRAAIKTVMTRCEVTRLVVPFGTISLSTRHESKLDVFDEGALISHHPDLYTQQEPKLNKAELGRRIASGERIEGAKLIPTEVLTIRR